MLVLFQEGADYGMLFNDMAVRCGTTPILGFWGSEIFCHSVPSYVISKQFDKWVRPKKMLGQLVYKAKT